jgi:hypothetical protein
LMELRVLVIGMGWVHWYCGLLYQALIVDEYGALVEW